MIKENQKNHKFWNLILKNYNKILKIHSNNLNHNKLILN